MGEKIDRAIELLAGKITQAIREDQALKYTQAALNLAHTKVLLENQKPRTKGAST